jgi:hypothetical protein
MPEKNPITGKKPRTSKLPTAQLATGELSPAAPTQIGNFTDAIALPYTVPVHDPNTLIPSDIYNPASSTAPRMKRDEADRHIETYNEMIAAQDVAAAGYNFISSVFKTHTSYQRALGDGFTALRETLSTQRKQVAAATAVVDLNTERLKFSRAVQLNQQANIKLAGEIVKTGLAQERVDTELLKLKTEIQGLKTQTQQAILSAQSLELSA